MAEVLDLKGFLFKCSDLYPFETKDSAQIKRQLDEYEDSIQNYINKSNKRYNFTKLFRIIKEKYKYAKMPGIEFILEKMPYAVDIPVQSTETDQQVFVAVLGRKDEEGNWTYSERNYVMCNFGGGRYVGDILKELRHQYNMVKEFTFPRGSTTPYHNKEKKQFEINVPSKELGELGLPTTETVVFYSYG